MSSSIFRVVSAARSSSSFPAAGSSFLSSSQARFNSSNSGASKPAAVTKAEGGQGEKGGELTPDERAERAVTADAISDAPEELHQRAVRIFRPAKSASTSGRNGTNHWRVDFDILQGSGRWENPLMGWASSADYMQGTSLKFSSKEAAIYFCEKQGWDYFVQEPHEARIPPKAYATNYVYSPGKLRIHHTK